MVLWSSVKGTIGEAGKLNSPLTGADSQNSSHAFHHGEWEIWALQHYSTQHCYPVSMHLDEKLPLHLKHIFCIILMEYLNFSLFLKVVIFYVPARALRIYLYFCTSAIISIILLIFFRALMLESTLISHAGEVHCSIRIRRPTLEIEILLYCVYFNWNYVATDTVTGISDMFVCSAL